MLIIKDLSNHIYCKYLVLSSIKDNNSYLLHRIIDSFSLVSKTSFVTTKEPKVGSNKTGVNIMILILSLIENCL